MTAPAVRRLHAVGTVKLVTVTIGIDPGPSTGIGVLHLDTPDLAGTAESFQCNARSAPWLLGRILDGLASAGTRARIGMEGFAPGHGPGAKMPGGQVTRAEIEQLAAIAAEWDVAIAARFAAVVKSWATDKRLKAAGLFELTAGGGHSRDGMRHSLFTAVHECGLADPLSRRGGP